MANQQIVRTFDLYNTVFYWGGYTGVQGLSTELTIAQAAYIANFSSNPIGSYTDLYVALADGPNNNKFFNIPAGVTISTLPFLWGRYWWEQAMFYSAPQIVQYLNTNYPAYYQFISESIGSLIFISRMNNLLNTQSVPYNTLIDRLLPPGVSSNTQSFYTTVNALFTANIAAIGPTGTDIAPNSSNLIMADTDLGRIISANIGLSANINAYYPQLSAFLSFNTLVIGNLIVPFNWTTQMPYDSMYADPTQISYVTVDFTNRNVNVSQQLTTNTLIYTP